MTAEQQQALSKLYLLRCNPTSPTAPWSYEREAGACEYLMDMRGVPYLKEHFSTSIKFSIGKEGEEDTEREGGANADSNIEEDIVEDDNGGSLL
jgi:hypothetical protein